MKINWFIASVYYLLIGCSSFFYVDTYDIFLAPKDKLTLECSEGSHGMDCYRLWPEFGCKTYVQVLHGWNCSIDRDSSLLTIDLQVYPKKVNKKTNFFPNLIIVTAGSDTLKAVKSKRECTGKPDRCCYRTSFRLMPAPMTEIETSTDTILFTIDLSKALSYNDAPLDIGVIRGKMTKQLSAG